MVDPSGEFDFQAPSHELVGRLGKLEELIGPNVDPNVSEFGRLLADRLHDNLVPMGFIMGSTLMLHDLNEGVSGFGDGPIDSPIVKRSPSFYTGLEKTVPALAAVAFGDEFAGEVLSVMKGLKGNGFEPAALTEPIEDKMPVIVQEVGELNDGTKLYVDAESMKLTDEYDLTTYNGYMSSGYHDFSIEIVASTLVETAKQLGVIAGVDEEGFWKINRLLNGGVVGRHLDNVPDHRKVEADGKVLYFPTAELLDAFWVAKKGGSAVDIHDKYNAMLLGTHPEAVEDKEEDNGTLPDMELPGKDPFEMILLNGELPSEGILLETKIGRAGCGVFEVYDYSHDSIEKIDYRESGEKGQHKYLRSSFKYNEHSNAKQLTFAYEQPNYFNRDEQPYNRSGITTYISHGFERLDAIDLTNKGRLLILKRAEKLGNLITRLDKAPWQVGTISGSVREDVRWFPKGDLKSLSEALRIITRDFIGGLGEQDAKTISDNVIGRLQEPSDFDASSN